MATLRKRKKKVESKLKDSTASEKYRPPVPSEPEHSPELDAREAMVPYLYNREIGANLAQVASAYLISKGLTVREIEISTIVSYYPSVTASEIAKSAGLSVQAVSPIVNNLVSRDLLRYETDESDRRRRRLYPGKNLQPYVDYLIEIFSEIYAAALADFSELERDVFVRVLKKLRNASRVPVNLHMQLVRGRLRKKDDDTD